MRAMILASLFGSRGLPYTEIRPKPLFPVLNRPLLLATVDRLRNSGFSDITVNCHHLHGQIADSCRNCDGVFVQYERKILGTGGGLRLACERMKDEPFLVTNGDIYHSIDFLDIYRRHLESGNEVTMVLHDSPRFNTVGISGDYIKTFAQKSGPGLLAYTGVQVINPAVLKDIKKDKFSCIIEYYRELIASGRRIGYIAVDDICWSDMGTPADYLALHRDLLQGQIPVWPELGGEIDNSFLVADNSQCSESCLEGWACVGRAVVEAGARVKRSVIWDGARVKSGELVADAIVIG